MCLVFLDVLLVGHLDCDDLFINSDWDSCYLAMIFNEDFCDMSSLWNLDGLSDMELVQCKKNMRNIVLLWKIFLWMMMYFARQWHRLSQSVCN